MHRITTWNIVFFIHSTSFENLIFGNCRAGWNLKSRVKNHGFDPLYSSIKSNSLKCWYKKLYPLLETKHNGFNECEYGYHGYKSCFCSHGLSSNNKSTSLQPLFFSNYIFPIVIRIRCYFSLCTEKIIITTIIWSGCLMALTANSFACYTLFDFCSTYC